MKTNKDHCTHYWLEVSKPFAKEVEVEIHSSAGVRRTTRSTLHSTWKCQLCNEVKDLPCELENWHSLRPKEQGALNTATAIRNLSTGCGYAPRGKKVSLMEI